MPAQFFCFVGAPQLRPGGIFESIAQCALQPRCQKGLFRRDRAYQYNLDVFHGMLSTPLIQGSVARRRLAVHQSWDPVEDRRARLAAKAKALSRLARCWGGRGG